VLAVRCIELVTPQHHLRDIRGVSSGRSILARNELARITLERVHQTSRESSSPTRYVGKAVRTRTAQDQAAGLTKLIERHTDATTVEGTAAKVLGKHAANAECDPAMVMARRVPTAKSKMNHARRRGKSNRISRAQ